MFYYCSVKSDVWAFACFCYEVFARKLPFYEDDNLLTIATKIVTEGAHPIMPEDTPDYIAEVCNQCWSVDPKERPSMEQIVRTFAEKRDAATKAVSATHNRSVGSKLSDSDGAESNNEE